MRRLFFCLIVILNSCGISNSSNQKLFGEWKSCKLSPETMVFKENGELQLLKNGESVLRHKVDYELSPFEDRYLLTEILYGKNKTEEIKSYVDFFTEDSIQITPIFDSDYEIGTPSCFVRIKK